MKKINLILIFLILSLSFLLSSRMILAGDFFYLFDQARDYLLTKDVVETGKLILIGTHSGLGGFFHGPLWIYMLTPVYVLGGGNPFSFVYFYILIQVVTIIASYLVGKKLYGINVGLLTAFIVSVSQAVWKTVPNTIGVNIMPLVFIGLFYFLVKFIRRDYRSFIFVAFLAGLSLQFETALPLILIPLVFLILLFQKNIFKHFHIIYLSILSFVLSIATFILFDLRHNFLMISSLFKMISSEEKGKGYLEIGDRLQAHFSSLLGVYKNLTFSSDGFSILLLLTIFIFTTYLFISRSNPAKKEYFFLLLFPFFTLPFFMLYPYKIWPEYIFGLVIPVSFALSLAISIIWKNKYGKILVLLFFGITFLKISTFIGSQYFKPYLQDNSSGSYLNQKAVVEWIYKDEKKGVFGYFVYSPSVYTHGMDYLIPWYGKDNVDIKLEARKHEITYLILYPHMENDENAYEFWKKNTIRTNGKVITSKIFKGGIIVEKLHINGNDPDVDPNYYQGLLFR